MPTILIDLRNLTSRNSETIFILKLGNNNVENMNMNMVLIFQSILIFESYIALFYRYVKLLLWEEGCRENIYFWVYGDWILKIICSFRNFVPILLLKRVYRNYRNFFPAIWYGSLFWQIFPSIQEMDNSAPYTAQICRKELYIQS